MHVSRKYKTKVNFSLHSHVSFPISFEVVIRRLPPSLTEEQLKEDLGGLPEHDFFYFVSSDMRYIKVLFVFCCSFYLFDMPVVFFAAVNKVIMQPFSPAITGGKGYTTTLITSAKSLYCQQRTDRTDSQTLDTNTGTNSFRL